jgi:hypothetical protein
MKAQTKTRIEINEFYLAVDAAGHCSSVSSPFGRHVQWCHEWIDQGYTIYFTNEPEFIHYIGHDIPAEVLAKLELAVTEVLEE